MVYSELLLHALWKRIYVKNKTTEAKKQKQITKWTSASSLDGEIGTALTLLPETTIKADEVHGTKFFKQ